MRPTSLALTAAAVATALVTGAAFGGSHGGDKHPAVVARQSHMQLYQHNLNTLGAMIRGNAEYDAEAASAAANNILTLTTLSQSTYWPADTDSDMLVESRALPAIWENYPLVIEKATAVNAAAQSLAEVAGTGLEPMQAATVALGQACTACHKEFRLSNN